MKQYERNISKKKYRCPKVKKMSVEPALKKVVEIDNIFASTGVCIVSGPSIDGACAATCLI